MEDIRPITYADAPKVQTAWKLGDIELLTIRIQYLDDISQSEPAELTKYEIISLLRLTKHLTLNSKIKADLEFEGKGVENYINLAKNTRTGITCQRYRCNQHIGLSCERRPQQSEDILLKSLELQRKVT